MTKTAEEKALADFMKVELGEDSKDGPFYIQINEAVQCLDIAKAYHKSKLKWGVNSFRKFLLKKFPIKKYDDCPIPSSMWDMMQEYAESYHSLIFADKDKEIKSLKEELQRKDSEITKLKQDNFQE